VTTGGAGCRLAPVPPHFDVQSRREGDDAVVLVTSGELDLASSDQLEEALAEATAEGTTHVIIDLRDLQFIDSVGLSVLIRADQRVRETGGRFGLVRGGPQVQRLLELTGLASRVALADTPEQLIAGT
jgi:anti-anti-sigma factor